MLQVVIWGYEEICLILYFVCCHYVNYFTYMIMKIQYLLCTVKGSLIIFNVVIGVILGHFAYLLFLQGTQKCLQFLFLIHGNEQSLFLVSYGPLFVLLLFAFTFGCSSCSMNCIGEYCESVP